MPAPATVEEAAALVRELGHAGRAVRPRGGGTKLAWGGSGEQAGGEPVELATDRLARILAHDAGDFTAVLEAGVRLADAQAAFARSGQLLALDPPLGDGEAATVGGVLATADSGPLRHRYGGPRDLVLGCTVVLSDGVIARSGGTVIKNVAGYDLAKLLIGSYGTLALIASVAVRLHPLPGPTATVVGRSCASARVAAAATRLASLPLEADGLDVSWREGAGQVLVRFSGGAAHERAQAAGEELAACDAVELVADDAPLWAAQRAGQRSATGAVVKASGRIGDLARVLRTADEHGAGVVARAGLGLAWLRVDDAPGLAERVARLRAALAPLPTVVLDGGDRCADPWPPLAPGLRALNARLKARLDPARAFRPGAFAGGI